MATTAQAGVAFPPRDLNSLLDLGRFLDMHAEPALLLGRDGEQVPLPEEVYRFLAEVVAAMRQGKVITLVPHTQRLTTQEAADFLGLSRPTLVKLLEEGKSHSTSRAGTAECCSPTCLLTESGSMSTAAPYWTK